MLAGFRLSVIDNLWTIVAPDSEKSRDFRRDQIREMYARPTDRVESRTTALGLLQAASFVHLVSNGASGFEATSLPMIVDRESDRLIGHLARANDHCRALDEQPVVVIAVASESYVSPSWYPSKSPERWSRLPNLELRGSARARSCANRSEPDQAGVMEGLSETLGSPTRMIEAMARALEADCER